MYQEKGLEKPSDGRAGPESPSRSASKRDSSS
jgi:hypothetical protein